MNIGGNNNVYQNENNQLRKLHEERIKRQKQKQNKQMIAESNQKFLGKQMKSNLNQNSCNNKNNNTEYNNDKNNNPVQTSRSSTSSLPSKLFLNSLLSDPRPIKQKPSSISLSSLFQDNPLTFSSSISKNIQSIFMTTYGFQFEVLSTIAQSGKPFYLLNDTQQNNPQGKIIRNYEGYENMTLIVPPRKNKGYGVFHMKIWVIKFNTFIRIVIGTGNQHVNDWVVWLNGYWYQDFQLKGMRICDYGENNIQEENNNKSNKEPEKIQENKEKQEKQKVQIKNKQKVTNKVIQKQKAKQTYKSQVNKLNDIISILDSDSQDCQKSLPFPLKGKSKQQAIKQTKPLQKHQQQKQLITQQSSKFNYQQDFLSTIKLILNQILPSSFNFQKQLQVDFNKYQFNNIKIVLIPSIPGRHYLKDGSMKKYGLAKVKHIIRSLGPRYKSGTLTYNTSSLGLIDEKFLRQIYFSFLPYSQQFSFQNYKIIYPTYKYITEQTCGQAQVLFLKKENYFKSQIKKEVFYHYQPSMKNMVKGAIPHLKTIIIEENNQNNKNKNKDDQNKNKCIFYMGSHNMTRAAWGTYEKDDTQINFSNSQLGVLFLDMDKEKLMNWLPYNYPPRKMKDYEKPYYMI